MAPAEVDARAVAGPVVFGRVPVRQVLAEFDAGRHHPTDLPLLQELFHAHEPGVEAQIASHHADEVAFPHQPGQLPDSARPVGEGFFDEEVAAAPGRLDGQFDVRRRRRRDEDDIRIPFPGRREAGSGLDPEPGRGLLRPLRRSVAGADVPRAQGDQVRDVALSDRTAPDHEDARLLRVLGAYGSVLHACSLPASRDAARRTASITRLRSSSVMAGKMGRLISSSWADSATG
ncbi:MAG: hypothetical protein A4E73_01750 [Syntrophaceae bacterium PtaU1.Bin231]|nr:MAG: hypothetical protein A4E73_01750 [Syntrophaceae bacterium PtaU1.Bin231]